MSALEFEISSSNPSLTDGMSTLPPRRGGQPAGSQLAKPETGSRVLLLALPDHTSATRPGSSGEQRFQYRAHLSPQMTQ